MRERDDLRTALLASGLRPIGGGSDVDTEGTAGETAGGDSTDGTQGNDEGREEQEHAQGREGQDSQAAGARGAAAEGEGAAAGESRENVRIRELNDRMRQAEMERDFLRRKLDEGQAGRRDEPRRFEVPEQFKEVDGHLGGYMRHYLGPLAEALTGFQREFQGFRVDVADQMAFYRAHPEFGSPHAQHGDRAMLIERATEALRKQFGADISREDVLSYLRGHPQYAAKFAAEAKTVERRAVGQEVAARRSAGTVGARQAAGGRHGEAEKPDLSRMNRADRVKHMESIRGDEAF